MMRKRAADHGRSDDTQVSEGQLQSAFGVVPSLLSRRTTTATPGIAAQCGGLTYDRYPLTVGERREFEWLIEDEHT